MIIQGSIPINQMKNIVDYYKPFDTGYMFSNGNRYRVAESYQMTTYDLIAVPYIKWQEEGTKYFNGNKDFIRVETMQALNRAVSMKGVQSENMNKYEDGVKAKTSMVSNGVMTHLKSYGQQGGNYRDFVSRS